ncbi:hypothetical protein [Rhodococcus sp. (in: high G+C Gram-positive bacteria)]|uniref:hypothetical protein n=1 Tax=Rhodococcus sp. TaxID=1831 RepID=UPI001F8D2743|nr:hypothetical protein [Prescottella equi]
MTALAGEPAAAVDSGDQQWPDGVTMRMSTAQAGASDSFLFFAELVLRTEITTGPKRMLVDTTSGRVDGAVTAVASSSAGIVLHLDDGHTVRLADVVAVTF